MRVHMSDGFSIPLGVHVCVYLGCLAIFEGVHGHGHVMYWCVTTSVHYSCMLHEYWHVTHSSTTLCVCCTDAHICVSVVHM